MKKQRPSRRTQVGGNHWRDALAELGDDMAEEIGKVEWMIERQEDKDAIIWFGQRLTKLYAMRAIVTELQGYRDSQYTSDVKRLAEAVEGLLSRLEGVDVQEQLAKILEEGQADE